VAIAPQRGRRGRSEPGLAGSGRQGAAEPARPARAEGAFSRAGLEGAGAGGMADPLRNARPGQIPRLQAAPARPDPREGTARVGDAPSRPAKPPVLATRGRNGACSCAGPRPSGPVKPWWRPFLTGEEEGCVCQFCQPLWYLDHVVSCRFNLFHCTQRSAQSHSPSEVLNAVTAICKIRKGRLITLVFFKGQLKTFFHFRKEEQVRALRFITNLG